MTLGCKQDANSCLLGGNRACDLPLRPQPLPLSALFVLACTSRCANLYKSSKNDADGFTMQVPFELCASFAGAKGHLLRPDATARSVNDNGRERIDISFTSVNTPAPE